MAHTEEAELLKKLAEVASKIRIGTTYSYRGLETQVTNLGFYEWTEPEETVVVFRVAGGGLTYVQSYRTWNTKSAVKIPTDLVTTFGVNSVAEVVHPGDHYYHYQKPDLHYRVAAIAWSLDHNCVCVVYEALYDNHIIWIRTFDGWREIPPKETVQKFRRVEA